MSNKDANRIYWNMTRYIPPKGLHEHLALLGYELVEPNSGEYIITSEASANAVRRVRLAGVETVILDPEVSPEAANRWAETEFICLVPVFTSETARNTFRSGKSWEGCLLKKVEGTELQLTAWPSREAIAPAPDQKALADEFVDWVETWFGFGYLTDSHFEDFPHLRELLKQASKPLPTPPQDTPFDLGVNLG